MKFFRYLLLLPLLCSVALAQRPKLILPIEGQPGRDFFIVNYVDHDTAIGSVRDYNCSDLTYDGHLGTDFVLRSFRQMDSGVGVLAAAEGIVFVVSDTAYDRNKQANPALGFGNWIGIAHAGGIYTYYAHIRKGSALVTVGDSVKAGQKIALVGSAGNATDPHVHLEVWTKDTLLLDPFAGSCNPGESLWLDQPPYDTSFAIIDQGLLDWVPTLDTLRERPSSSLSFSQPDTAVTFWIHGRGLRTGDSERIEWYTPDGSLWFSYDFPAFDRDYGYFYFWSYINLPPTSGVWYMQYLINHGKKVKVSIKQAFTVESASGVEGRGRHGGVNLRIDPTDPRMITVSLPEAQFPAELLEAAIFDATGRKLATLHTGSPEGTTLRFSLHDIDLPRGVYFLHIRYGDLAATVPLAL